MSEWGEPVDRSDVVLAWHFVADTLRDGRPIPPDGVWLCHDGPIEMCSSGLHASVRILDALKYAPGNTICRVECRGDFDAGEDKCVFRERRILWRVDGAALLRAFARWCALQVVHLWTASAAVHEYLTRGDESKRDAARAAWDAARDAARDACSAARDAAQNAAWAARAAEAAGAAQNEQLEAMVEAAQAGKTEWVFEMPEEVKSD